MQILFFDRNAVNQTIISDKWDILVLLLIITGIFTKDNGIYLPF